MDYFLIVCLVVFGVGWWFTIEELKTTKHALETMKRHSEYAWDRTRERFDQLLDAYKEIDGLKNEVEYWKNRAKSQEAVGAYVKEPR